MGETTGTDTERQDSTLTGIVTRQLTSFGNAQNIEAGQSFSHKSYGYLRGPEAVARALPN